MSRLGIILMVIYAILSGGCIVLDILNIGDQGIWVFILIIAFPVVYAYELIYGALSQCIPGMVGWKAAEPEAAQAVLYSVSFVFGAAFYYLLGLIIEKAVKKGRPSGEGQAL